MKISGEVKKIAQGVAILLAIAFVVYINSTASMSMGNFSGNGR